MLAETWGVVDPAVAATGSGGDAGEETYAGATGALCCSAVRELLAPCGARDARGAAGADSRSFRSSSAADT